MNDRSQHPNNLFNQSEIHKNYLTSYKIIVPLASTYLFEKDIIIGGKTESFDFFFTKQKYCDVIQSIYQSLKTNYERECGDLTKFTDPDHIYFIIASELSPGLKKTKNFKYVGMIEVFDDIIQFMWLHPFLRNKNIMTMFFQWYAKNENMLCLQPPITNACLAMTKKVQDLILNNEDAYKNQMNFARKYFMKKSPNSEAELLTDYEIGKVRQCLEIHSATSGQTKNDQEYSEIIEAISKSIKFLRDKPETQKHLAAWSESYMKPENFKKKLEEFIKYGSK